MKPVETIWTWMKSWFSQVLYKTKNISQNLKHSLNVLATQNTTKSKTWLKVSSKRNPNMSLYKIKNLLGGDSRYPTISHKKMFCAKRYRVRFVGTLFGGMQIAWFTDLPGAPPKARWSRKEDSQGRKPLTKCEPPTHQITDAMDKSRQSFAPLGKSATRAHFQMAGTLPVCQVFHRTANPDHHWIGSKMRASADHRRHLPCHTRPRKLLEALSTPRRPLSAASHPSWEDGWRTTTSQAPAAVQLQ